MCVRCGFRRSMWIFRPSVKLEVFSKVFQKIRNILFFCQQFGLEEKKKKLFTIEREAVCTEFYGRPVRI